jgi:hypothetical protein
METIRLFLHSYRPLTNHYKFLVLIQNWVVEQSGNGLQRMGCWKKNYIQVAKCGTILKNPKYNMPELEEHFKLKMRWCTYCKKN